MVSSYLICDICGQVGPPSSILSEDGLRLCYSCWFQAHQSEPLVGADTPLPNEAEACRTAVERLNAESSEG